MKIKRTRRKWTVEQKREIAEAVHRRLLAGEPINRISGDLDILGGIWITPHWSAKSVA